MTSRQPPKTERAFLTAEWSSLAFINFEIEPDALAPFTPPGTEIDLWNGRCYISVVGLRFLGTKLMGAPIPFHRNFDEVNLRFYVRREHEGQTRRGVVFVKEIVPRRAVAWVARNIYNENYTALPMRHEIRPSHLRYEWRVRDEWNSLTVEALGDWRVPEPASEAAFITDHYWGYVVQPNGSTLEYEVEHRSWRVTEAHTAELVCDVERLYGEPFVRMLSQEPTSAFLADGSEVVVRRGRPIESTAAST